MAGVVAGECSYSESGVSSDEKQEDNVDIMRGEEEGFGHQIPLDLMIEIMTRSSVKSLKRFQCVSKEWISIIQRQVFIDSFSAISQTRPRFLVAVRTHMNRVLLFSSSNRETEVPTTTSLPFPKLRLLVNNPIRYTCLHTNLEMTMSGSPVDLVRCSSVHGLFSLSYFLYPGRFTIYNPSTRQAINITVPDNKPSSCNGRRERIMLFLGYDPVSNEYKALSSAGYSGEPFQEHKVLTLGGGGGSDNLSWRDIDEGTKIERYIAATNKICINGIVYCGVLTTRRPLIFWFNVRDEKIGYLETYSSLIRDGSLINFNGRLAAAYPLPCDPIHCFRICIQDDRFGWLRIPFNVNRTLSDLSGNIQLNILGKNKTNEFVLGPVMMPPKDQPLYIYYYKKSNRVNIRRVELQGFEEFGCEHKSDEKCACQILLSPDHFETLVSL